MKQRGHSMIIASIIGLAIFALLNVFTYDDASSSSSLRLYSSGEISRSLQEGDTTTNNNINNDSGPTFIFIMGIEGSGHHYINTLLSQSPTMNIIRDLNMCNSNSNKDQELLYQLSSEFMDGKKPGLMKPYNSNKKKNSNNNKNVAAVDFDAHYNNVVELLSTISQKIINSDSDSSSKHQQYNNINIPINANSCTTPSMLSYPNFRGIDRSLQNFNLDLFYDACSDANVNCRHVYIYRDPYDILKSTTVNRPFNKNVSDGIRLYTSVLQQIHSQLVAYPTRNVGCFGFLDVNGGYDRRNDWINFGTLFGWKMNSRNRKHDFLHLAKEEIMMMHDGDDKGSTPVAMTEEMKVELVSQYDRPLMNSFYEIHDRVKDYCYESLLSSSESVEDSIMTEERRMSSSVEITVSSSSSMLEERAKPRGLVHVFSPFRGNRGSNNSLEQIEQVAMLTSVRRAKENFITTKLEGHDSKDVDDNNIVIFDEIVIVCAVTDQDDTEWTNLLTNYCDEIVTLPRNVRDEYPSSMGLKPLPFVQDIINAGLSIGAQRFGDNDDYYLMFTNADICLTEHFFNTLHDKHLTKYKEAVIINRMSVSHLDVADIPPRVVDDGDLSLQSIEDAAMKALQQAKVSYENGHYQRHPGSDCFVAHASIWQSVHLGDVFLGHPPIGSLILLAFTQMIGINKYGIIKSNKDGTFHFGDDRLWKKKGAMNKFPSDFHYSAEEAIQLIQHCVVLHGHVILTEKHWFLNGINCGKLLYNNQESTHGTTIFRQAFLTKEEESKDSKVLYPHCNWKAHQCEYTPRHPDVHSIRLRPILKKPTDVLQFSAMFEAGTEIDIE